MNNPFFKNAVGSVVILLGLLVALVPYSVFLGWNVISLLLFWFVIVPLVAIRLPYWIKLPGHPFLISVSGVILFYGFMVFMTYKQYKTDYFVVMIVSMISTIFVLGILGLMRFLSFKRTSTSS